MIDNTYGLLGHFLPCFGKIICSSLWTTWSGEIGLFWHWLILYYIESFNANFFYLQETRTLAEIAKVELDNMPLRGKQLRVRFACHSASLTVRNLPQFVSNELLEEAFSVFGQVERAVVIVDDRGRSSGKGIVEFSGKPAARKALDRCSDGSFLLTT